MRFTFSWIATLLLGAAPGLAGDDMRAVGGQLTYAQRVALPPGAKVEVTATGLFDTTLGTAQFKTKGRQVPITFDMNVPSGVSGRITVVIRADERPWWIAQGIAFGAGKTPVDLGEIGLEPFTPLAFAIRYDCGGTLVEAGLAEDMMILRTDGRDVVLEQVPAASGARYAATDDSGTEFWSRGDSALVMVEGVELPECHRQVPGLAPYRAGGNEPGWSVVLTPQTAEITADYGAITHSVERPTPTVSNGAYLFDMPQVGAEFRIAETLCHDDATGMPHPHSARLILDGAEMSGCGGDPASLLTGADWQIEDIAGNGIVNSAQITIAFSPDGRIAGTTGCNSFTGGYTLTGEGLSLQPAGVTMMACPEALMAQEGQMLDALAQVWRFDLDDSGALLLIGGAEDGPLLTARR